MKKPYNSNSSPAAIFEMIKEDFAAAVRSDTKMKEIFDRVGKFEGVFNTTDDAKRLDDLRKKGADKLEITVGVLPLAIGPGLAFMYDVALEAIRLEPKKISSRMFKIRALRTAESLFEAWLLNIGACSVVALERALEDKEYAERLRERGKDLGWIALDNRTFGICDFCTIVVTDSAGRVEVICPSEEACNNLGWLILVLFFIWLTYKIVDWLWD